MYTKSLRHVLLLLGVGFNIALLGYYKYTDFFIENLNAWFRTDIALQHILLPLGISFFTFQQIAFVVDSYRKETILPKFHNYCNFVTFFPQLIAGPIVLPEEMLPQFEDRKNKLPIYKNLLQGFCLFSLGLAKKVIIADSIAGFANAGFDTLSSFTMAEAWLTSISYTLQLYFDFSGYCDMAMGIALMFNIYLPLNFNAPYKATNFQDFWRRWHITLSRFLTHYLYIPLGGNRRGEIRTLVNIMIVFLVSGFWHGAGWTFVVWGLLHGLCSVVNRLWHLSRYTLSNWVALPLTFFFINLFWAFFRAESIEKAKMIICAMFVPSSFILTKEYMGQLASILPNRVNLLILVLAFILAFIGPTAYQIIKNEAFLRVKVVSSVLIFVISTLFITRVVTFLYFNF